MKIFVCHRSTEKLESERIINSLFQLTENSIAVLRETDHDEKHGRPDGGSVRTVRRAHGSERVLRD